MVNIFDPNYFSRAELENKLMELGRSLSQRQTLVDLGCGKMPYKKYFQCKYVGVDSSPNSGADIIAPAWNTKLRNNSADAIILIQSLEHISRTSDTVREIYRILKPGGWVFVSVPQTMPNHGPIGEDGKQEDYYRFTPNGLLNTFNRFKPVYIIRTCGYWGTIFQLINYYFYNIAPGIIFSPLYLINNILGNLLDIMNNQVQLIMAKFGRKYYQGESLTLNYLYLGKK